MADKKEEKPAVDPQEAPAVKADETIPGGAYLVNGQLVDCDNNPIDTKKKKSE